MSTITKAITGGLGASDGSEPTYLFLHGYRADERDLPGLVSFLPTHPWASPRAPIDSQYGGYAWFPIETPLNPSASLVEPATQVIWDWVDGNLPDESPLIVIGFSQGGLMATQLLRTRPERILGTVILAGFIMDAPQPADASLTASKPRVIYCRGNQDQVVTREAAAKLNLWLQKHTKAVTKTYDGLGHSIDERVMADVREYVSTVCFR